MIKKLYHFCCNYIRLVWTMTALGQLNHWIFFRFAFIDLNKKNNDCLMRTVKKPVMKFAKNNRSVLALLPTDSSLRYTMRENNFLKCGGVCFLHMKMAVIVLPSAARICYIFLLSERLMLLSLLSATSHFSFIFHSWCFLFDCFCVGFSTSVVQFCRDFFFSIQHTIQTNIILMMATK